jgi:DNA-binding NtrC family response regulator
MTGFSIFLVDDEQVARDGIALALRKHYNVRAFVNAEEALDALSESSPDLVLLDIGLPGMSGIEALERIKADHPDLPVIMITAYEDVETVVSAMKLGAHDYVVKPLQMDGLLVSVRNALETITLRKEVQQLQERFLKENMPVIVGESNALSDVMDIVGKVAKSPDTPILIEGETGTGKELIAKAIHYRSPNFSNPMVSVNCAAIPGELIESELFGYEKGAFTGAGPIGKNGLVEQAAGGTLFLDEIGDLSLEAQAKILRFLEAGEYYRVGSTRRRTVKTRVITATNRDLAAMIEEGGFRRDLYHRFAVVKVEVPSLNERTSDIIPIARYFLAEFNQKFNTSITGLSPEAQEALKNHNFTGNVRELKNLMERAVLLSDGHMLDAHHLGLDSDSNAEVRTTSNRGGLAPLSEEGVDLPSLLLAVEKDYFDAALRMANGNESHAAKLLNMSRDTFRYRRKNH